MTYDPNKIYLLLAQRFADCYLQYNYDTRDAKPFFAHKRIIFSHGPSSYCLELVGLHNRLIRSYETFSSLFKCVYPPSGENASQDKIVPMLDALNRRFCRGKNCRFEIQGPYIVLASYLSGSFDLDKMVQAMECMDEVFYEAKRFFAERKVPGCKNVSSEEDILDCTPGGRHRKELDDTLDVYTYIARLVAGSI